MRRILGLLRSSSESCCRCGGSHGISPALCGTGKMIREILRTRTRPLILTFGPLFSSSFPHCNTLSDSLHVLPLPVALSLLSAIIGMGSQTSKPEDASAKSGPEWECMLQHYWSRAEKEVLAAWLVAHPRPYLIKTCHSCRDSNVSCSGYDRGPMCLECTKLGVPCTFGTDWTVTTDPDESKRSSPPFSTEDRPAMYLAHPDHGQIPLPENYYRSFFEEDDPRERLLACVVFFATIASRCRILLERDNIDYTGDLSSVKCAREINTVLPPWLHFPVDRSPCACTSIRQEEIQISASTEGDEARSTNGQDHQNDSEEEEVPELDSDSDFSSSSSCSSSPSIRDVALDHDASRGLGCFDIVDYDSNPYSTYSGNPDLLQAHPLLLPFSSSDPYSVTDTAPQGSSSDAGEQEAQVDRRDGSDVSIDAMDPGNDARASTSVEDPAANVSRLSLDGFKAWGSNLKRHTELVKRKLASPGFRNKLVFCYWALLAACLGFVLFEPQGRSSLVWCFVLLVLTKPFVYAHTASSGSGAAGSLLSISLSFGQANSTKNATAASLTGMQLSYPGF